MRFVIKIHDPKDVNFVRDESGAVVAVRIYNEIVLAKNITPANSAGVNWLQALASEEMLKGQAFGL